MFPHGLHSIVGTLATLMARDHMPALDDFEFVGMAYHVRDSIYNILSSDLGSKFGTPSSGTSHNLVCECFMANSPEGHDSYMVNSRETLEEILVLATAFAPPCLTQSWARQGQIRDDWCQIEREFALRK